ncbi:DUF308 domain-containing protein [Candidatus Saccharibacteria bacterium]|nr:DUF308 domain-containing protein [Candidatus Saccharibacteria bacterium]
MAHINRRYIDKHWFVFVLRGAVATIFGFLALFGGLTNLESIIATISVFLLGLGIIDAVSALYGSTKKRGWLNSIIDALVDVAAAVALLFAARNDLVLSLVILAIYTFVSGIIDIFHAFLSTVDPTDRFIRIVAGVLGCVMGFVILNAGSFEIMTFIRFFGAYMLIVGVTSMIYGVHNKAQKTEDSIARSESSKKRARRASTVTESAAKQKIANKALSKSSTKKSSRKK